MKSSDFIKNYSFKLLLSTIAVFVVCSLPLLITTGCDGLNPTGPTSSDTCDISYVVLTPASITVTTEDDRVVFTAEAYDSEDRLLDPAPTFSYSCDSREVTITGSGNRVYASPWTATSEPAHITVSARNCSGREFTDTSTMIVNDSPTMLFIKKILKFLTDFTEN